MSIIGVVSMKGGVGKTTVTANLAAAMAKTLGPHRVSVIELDPQNALHLHFGVDDTQSAGVCRQSLIGGDWREIRLLSEFDVQCLPYGAVSELDRIGFESLLNREPAWIGQQIQTAGLDDDAVVFIDTPPGPSPYLKQVFSCADVVVIVVLADAASYATIPAMESWLEEMSILYPHTASLYLINQIDRTELLNRDVVDLLNQRLEGKISPIGIHSDESVREALAFQQPVMAYAPHGQASNDLARISNWLIDVLNQ
jgi:cellulose synthase operon protein YhjQ